MVCCWDILKTIIPLNLSIISIYLNTALFTHVFSQFRIFLVFFLFTEGYIINVINYLSLIICIY